MEPSRWNRIAELFSEALAIEPSRREAFLAQRSRGDPELKAEVESLLGANDRAAGLLERPIGPVALELLARSEAAEWMPGERIGPYRLVRELGHGGMGTVFLAERAFEGVTQQVAIKRLDGWHGPDLARRFRTEVQALLKLEHPAIARILDFGETASGQPYLLLEYVEGIPVTEYCDRGRLSISLRLDIFLQICEAVGFAHRKLVVHCDLKPSNVLVGADGQVKLLDFGISKLLDPGLSEASLTPLEAHPLTPEYASPEQLSGEPVSVASDVYSLGVVLCELLAGARPRQLYATGPGPDRCIPPSRALAEAFSAPGGRPGPGLDEVAARRQETPGRFLRQLRGDLDAILLRALALDPGQRYATVDALAADVRHHRASRPVAARQGTWAYSAARALRRHAAGFAFVAALVGVLTTSTVVASVQAGRIARERDVAERVTAFLIDLFEISNPSEAKGNQITARSLLDRAAASLELELEDQPEVRIRLLGTMARVYENLGLYTRARLLLEEARDTLRREQGEGSTQMTELLSQLGNLSHRQGRLEEAETLLREVMARVEAEPFRANRRATVLIELGGVLDDVARFEESEPMLREAPELARHARPFRPLLLSDALTALARSLYLRSRYSEAEPLMREALVLRRQADPTSPETAQALNNLGELLRALGRLEEAQRLLEEAVQLRQRLLGADHPDVAASLNNLGQVHFMRGRPAEAVAALTLALGSMRALGEEHPSYGTVLNNLAAAVFAAGDLRRAEDLFRQTLALRRKTFPASHPDVARALHNLAAILHHQGRLGEAIPLFRESLALRRAALGDRHADVANTLDSLATCLSYGAGTREAEELYREALALRTELLPPGHPDIARSQAGLGRLLDATQRPADAEPLLRAARAALVAALGSEHRDAALATNHLGTCLLHQGKEEEARRLLAESAAAIRAGFPSGSWPRRVAETNLAKLAKRR